MTPTALIVAARRSPDHTVAIDTPGTMAITTRRRVAGYHRTVEVDTCVGGRVREADTRTVVSPSEAAWWLGLSAERSAR